MTQPTGLPYSTIVFDLDGTLIDTAPDMVAALNTLLAEMGHGPCDYTQARAHVSRGAFGLIDSVFGTLEEAHRLSLRNRYLALYAQRIAHESSLFDGMAEVLDRIEHAGMPWGIVTNKPGFLTEPLLAALGLAKRSAATVSGDTLPVRKPHPQPLLHAAQQAGVKPARSIYVGDDARDITAGNAAGMMTVTALWGFILPDEDPHAWPADHRITRPIDLLTILGRTTA